MSTAGNDRVVVFHNGKVVTMQEGDESSIVESIAISQSTGRVLAIGSSSTLLSSHPSSSTSLLIDLRGRTLIPGLIDSHLHFIREGNHFTLELRWDGVRSLTTALSMLRAQALRTPPGQWVRVVGGWCEAQFDEKRLPTLAELDEACGDVPVFILHLYDCALVNRAGMALLGYTASTPNPPSGELVRHPDGTPTGVLIARPNAFLLYNTLDKLPKHSDEEKANSTLAYARELNRFGVTSCLDPGGGFQAYPRDYSVIQRLDAEKRLTVRISYSLFPQRPKHELEDFQQWATMVKPGDGSPYLRMLGAGEMLAFSAADFEDFKEPRPDLPADMEGDLDPIVRFLCSQRWPFRLHATYGESIERELALFETIEREKPGALSSLRWFIDHAETVTRRDIDRIHTLGGGIAIQHRMAYQGEYFQQRYGAELTAHAPPLAAMREAKLPVGAGTDGTRVASYNPWVCLQWLVTGKSVGGLQLARPNASGCDPASNCMSRLEALRMWTAANAWFCNDDKVKGRLTPGYYADLVVLDGDYLTMDEEAIGHMEAQLTMVDGRVVYVDPAVEGQWGALELPKKWTVEDVSTEWSPVRHYGGYQVPASTAWPVQAGEVGGEGGKAGHVGNGVGNGTVKAASAQVGGGGKAPPNPFEFFHHGHDC